MASVGGLVAVPSAGHCDRCGRLLCGVWFGAFDEACRVHHWVARCGCAPVPWFFTATLRLN